MRNFFASLIIILISMGCGSNGQKQKNGPLESVTTYTTVDAVLNIGTNEYIRVTAKRTVYDTVMMVVVDSSDGKYIEEKRKVRDTSYQILYPWFVPDTTGKKPLRNKAGTADSSILQWTPIEKRLILNDLNKNWPVKP